MQKIVWYFSILAMILYADLSVDQIQKMVIKIDQKRESIKPDILEDTKEPFVHEISEKNDTVYLAPKKQEAKLSLHAILNGKAFINTSWIGIGEIILGYQLKYIGKKGVVLRNEHQIKKLFLHHKRKENYILIQGRE